MAVSLLSHEVSDLCIGKPALSSLPITATVGEAIAALKLCEETYLSVVFNNSKNNKTVIAGKVCMVDVICYLCSEDNIGAPAAVLKNPVSVLLNKDAGLVRRVEANSSILDAIDVILDSGAHSLVVPIGGGYGHKKLQSDLCCWLTQEDLIRFFLNNIFLFPSIAALSVTSLGLVRPTLLSLRHSDPAISALPLIRSALADQTSVAVLTDDNKLIGEISPSTLACCDETVAAAIASLSAGDLMAYIDCSSGGTLPESVVQAVKASLMEKGMMGMLELIEKEEEFGLPVLLSSVSSSSDEESTPAVRKQRVRRTRSGSYSARMGRRSEEAIVCHPGSSLVAVMVQAMAHRVSYVWVVEEDYGLVGVVAFQDVLMVFREQLYQPF